MIEVRWQKVDMAYWGGSSRPTLGSRSRNGRWRVLYLPSEEHGIMLLNLAFDVPSGVEIRQFQANGWPVWGFHGPDPARQFPGKTRWPNWPLPLEAILRQPPFWLTQEEIRQQHERFGLTYVPPAL